jgi:hypothetical protein
MSERMSRSVSPTSGRFHEPRQRLERLGNFLSTTRGHYIFLALSALVVLLGDRNWPYPNGYTTDPWIYYGYFWDYPLYASRFFPNTYYGTRLPWILPGYVVIHLLPYLVGTFVFVLSVYYAAVFSFYSLITRLFNRHIGLFAALLLGTDYYFLKSVSWYYVDAGVVTYLILTLLCLVLTCQNAGRRFPFLAGWAATSMVLCHFLSGALLPGLFAYLAYAAKNAPQWKDKVASVMLFAAAGGACCLGFLDLINFTVTGHFFFFMPQVMVLFGVNQISATYDQPFSYWAPTARWCIIPLLSVLSGAVLVLIYARRRSAFQGVQTVALLSSLGTLLLLLPLQAAGLLYLQYSDYVVFFMPLCCLIVGGALYMLTAGKPLAAYLIAPFMFLAYFLRTWTKYDIGGFFHPVPGPKGWVYRTLAAIAGQKIAAAASYLALAMAILLTVGVLLPLPWKGWRLRSCLFLLGLAGCAMTVGEYGWYGPRSLWELRQDAYQRIRTIANGHLPRLWYNAKTAKPTPLVIYRDLASTYLWEYSVVNEDFPSLEKSIRASQPGDLRSGDLVVILTDTPEVKEEVSKSLEQRRLRWNQTSAQRVARNGDSFWIIAGDVIGLPRPSRIRKE